MEPFVRENSARHRPHLPGLVLIVAILGLAFILRMKFWGQPFEMDEGAHAYMGWGMLQGLVPYRDMYNGKPPGIYLIHALLFLVAEPTALNIKLFASIYTLGTTLAVYYVTRKIAGKKAGIAAALLFGIFSPGPKIQGGGVNSEVFMVLPYTLAALSLLKALDQGKQKDYFLTGLWTGLACTFKQVAGVNLFWVACYFLIRVGRIREGDRVSRITKDVLWVAAGATVPWLPFILYLYLNNAISQFYYWQVGSGFAYMVAGHRGFSSLGLLLKQMKSTLGENGILWLLALAGIVSGWKKYRHKPTADSKPEEQRRQQDAWILMATWPFFSFIGVAAGGRYFAHYFIQLLPPLAVLSGAGLADLIQKARADGFKIFRQPITLLVIVGFVLFIKTDIPYYFKYDEIQISMRQYGTPLFSVSRYIGKYLRAKTQPDDLVFVWAVNSEINFYALRKSPSPFVMHVNFETVPWDAYEEVMQSLHKAPPKYIVEMQPTLAFPALHQYVHKNYIAETSDDLDQLKLFIPFQLYRRK